jgi:hypothetical protein
MAQKIKLDLSRFKASGVYTLEFDASENIFVTPQTIRLVVGFSKKGPFNSPVFCPDIKTARTVFGDIDSQLERKGSFFHRALFTCLATGPVFALNLLALNDDTETSPDNSDKINYKSFSIDTEEINGVLTPRLYSSFFNKERFWFPDTEYFQATVSVADQPKFFHITNLGKTPLSVITKKSDIKGYDLTVKEWYAGTTEERPAFLDDNDYINDYFVDVIAIEGNWTDFAALSIDPVYSKYFNAKGFKKEFLDQFLSLPEISLVAKITGCLIPDFKDKNGVNQFIETLVNNTTAVSGLFVSINKKALDDIENNSSQIDLVGHHLIDAAVSLQRSFEFLSYKAPLVNDYEYADYSPSYIVYSSPFDVIIAPEGSDIYNDWKTGTITDGDYIIKDAFGTKQFLKFFAGTDSLGDPYVEVRAYDSDTFLSQENIALFGTSYNTSGSLVATNLNIVSLYGNYNEFFDTLSSDPSKPALGSNEAIISAADAAKMKVGDLLVDSSGTRLTRIVKMAKYDIAGNVRVTANQPLKFYASNRIQRFQRIQDYVKELQYYYLQGFTLKETHMPNGSGSRMNEILDVLYNTNLAKTLKSKDAIDFRYIVDTFNHGLEPNSKSRLSKLAKDRQKCIALLNTPSMKEFLDSTDPRFTDAPTASNPKPVLNTLYIAQGGNLSLNPSFTYSLPDEELGNKYCGFFSPNLILRINGKNLSVPPSAHVSNNFIQKFIAGTPYAIVAGSRRGIISDPNLVGVEYEFSDEDRENLEPFGFNPIIRKRGQGVQIFGNQTGFQRVNSALNNLHVRDLLVTIETDVEAILERYLFEFNDPATRLEIKTKVDNYLEGVQSAGGIYDFAVIMDTSNNTNEIIDQNIGIIDVIIEPARGIHKFINRVTIVKTGGVSSGGFAVFA